MSYPDELRGPDVPSRPIPKHKRWANKKYTDWVATLPCAGCSIHDETIVPHHMKHICQELTGGMGMKASDWLAMPLCFSCHDKVHNADRWLIEYQPIMVLKTLDSAFRVGILDYKGPRRLFGEDLDD